MNSRILITFIFLIATMVGFAQKSRHRATVNKPPKINSFNSDIDLISRCPWSDACSLSDGIIKLTVYAQDPDGDPLQFKCTTSAGKLSKCGASMSWDLSKQPNGVFSASVTVTDGRGGEDKAELHVTIADCGSCDPPPPPCPTITISLQDGSDTKHLRFKVEIKGGDEAATPSYYWTAGLGKIIKGEQASEVVIDASDLEGEELTVQVDVRGFDPSCSTVQSQRLLVKQN
jgi:hypothetical protein